MHEKQTNISVKEGMNAIHHQRGVFPSTIPAIESESHPMLRRWATKGIRSSSTGVCGITGTSLISCSAISELLSRRQPLRARDEDPHHVHASYVHPAQPHTHRYSTASCDNQASSDSDFGPAPNRSGADACPENRALNNRDPVSSPAKRGCSDRADSRTRSLRSGKLARRRS